MMIRQEQKQDIPHVYAVNQSAFERPGEADLVDAVRGHDGVISLVAEHGDKVVGHILFTPVTIAGDNTKTAIALGPMAVLPEYQRQGVGSRLIEAGLEACESAGHPFVVVLGHPDYYPRFGFRPAHEHGLYFWPDTPSPAFMVREIVPGALAEVSGTVAYLPAFSGV